MKKLTIYTVVSAAVLTMLVACGGGSNSDTAPVANATAGSFTADVGTYKTMTLTELKYIVAVAREKHFGRAAIAVHIRKSRTAKLTPS